MSTHIEIARANRQGFSRLILEQAEEGVYVFVYKTDNSEYPEIDHLQDDLKHAKKQCLDDYGVPIDAWKTDTQTSPIMGRNEI